MLVSPCYAVAVGPSSLVMPSAVAIDAGVADFKSLHQPQQEPMSKREVTSSFFKHYVVLETAMVAQGRQKSQEVSLGLAIRRRLFGTLAVRCYRRGHSDVPCFCSADPSPPFCILWPLFRSSTCARTIVIRPRLLIPPPPPHTAFVHRSALLCRRSTCATS